MLARPDRTLRTEMIAEVMQYGYINSPNSAFNEIHQVPPASVTSWRYGKTTTATYWTADFETKVTIPYEEALETTKELIEAAVSRRLFSERPLGSFLSGGYDSTVVTAYMAKLMKERVQTYSIGFYSEAFNEAHHAKSIAEYLGTNHHEEYLSPNPSLVLEKISQVLDQPFADSSIIPTYLLAKFARENLVVALSGDGGDEIFGGYDRYLAAPMLQRFNPILGLAKSSLNIAQTFGSSNGRKRKRVSVQMRRMPSLGNRYFSIQSLVQPDAVLDILEPRFYSKASEYEFLRHFNSNLRLSKLDQLVSSDLGFYLPGDILSKIDRASMANSLELRSPMLDVNVVEWGLSLPSRYKIKGFETKHILKDVARSLVPIHLIDRPKMGFGIPRADWLRTDMKDMVLDLLTDSTATQRGWFKELEVARNINEHMAGRDRDNILWPILMLELWARTWLD
jgi:asparagine synthase (glutamine-hydrolysing)